MKPDISIIIPVINEQARIKGAIERLKKNQPSLKLEIIVVDGDENGSTINFLMDSAVTKLSCLPGRGMQLNTGAKKATADILLFLHCDTILPINGLRLIRQVMSDSRVDAGAFDLAINSRKKAFRVIEKIVSLRSRLTRIPYGDQAVFIRRRLLKALGGFKNIPLMEDVELMQRIKKHGKKLQIIRQPVQTSARRWEKEGLVYTTLRNWTILTLYYLGVPPEKLVQFYRTP